MHHDFPREILHGLGIGRIFCDNRYLIFIHKYVIFVSFLLHAAIASVRSVVRFLRVAVYHNYITQSAILWQINLSVCASVCPSITM